MRVAAGLARETTGAGRIKLSLALAKEIASRGTIEMVDREALKIDQLTRLERCLRHERPPIPVTLAWVMISGYAIPEGGGKWNIIAYSVLSILQLSQKDHTPNMPMCPSWGLSRDKWDQYSEFRCCFRKSQRVSENQNDRRTKANRVIADGK